MKTIKIIFGIISVFLFSQCTTEKFNDLSFLKSISQPDNVTSVFNITNDNSGNVTVTPGGEGAGSYDVYFGDSNAEPTNVNPGESITHKYAEGQYTVKIVANGIDGKTTENTFPLTVTYRAPENLETTLTTSKHTLTVSAKALYAASYLVYFGDVTNEVATPLADGESVSHEYASSGKYNVTVVALSGGAATTESTEEVSIYDPFGFPIDFENPNINYFFGTFGNASFESTVDNPAPGGINTSSKVGKYIKNSGAEVWSGTYSPLDNPIDFSTGNIIKMQVYAPDASLIGKKINVELEYEVNGNPANGVGVLKVPITQANTWEELTFDFSTNTAIPSTAKFKQLVLRFDDSQVGGGEVFYIDNIRITF